MGKRVELGLLLLLPPRRQGNKGWCLVPGRSSSSSSPQHYAPAHSPQKDKPTLQGCSIIDKGRGEGQLVFFYICFPKQLPTLPMTKSIICRSELILLCTLTAIAKSFCQREEQGNLVSQNSVDRTGCGQLLKLSLVYLKYNLFLARQSSA